ncbi:transcriptional regulator, partial [Salmonella enterica subsp. enterica serovar Hadar]|nr:transcriptional regulator [Salmonella enterica subsp. enterica serovar Haifa]ECS4949419.1 transcriptional regulator [Salmonella enterica subsp. enterica serovar Hadar]MBJ5777753.1 transcriptional regulator [Salmonella enterica subsp. enterica serovar Derby]
PLDANEPSNSLSEIPTSSSRDMLDDKEKALLALFNQMPEAEKNRLIVHAKATLQELDLLKDDVLSIIKNIRE